MKIDQVIEELQKEFPGITGIKKIKESQINLGDCAEGGDIDGLPACDYYSDDFSIYEFGVHKKLVIFLEERGYTAECYDPGTFIAYIN